MAAAVRCISQPIQPTLVGRWIGGNPATANKNDGKFPGSHSSYTGYLPTSGTYIQAGDDPDKRVNLREVTDKNWGQGNYSVPVYVPPTPPKVSTPKKEGSGGG